MLRLLQKVACRLMALSSLLWPLPAQAESSAACIYGILIEIHEVNRACQRTIPDVQLQRYNRMTEILRLFIKSNPTTKQSINVDEWILSFRKDLEEKLLPDICENKFFGVETIDVFLSEKFEQYTIELLKTPKDPFIGDCL